MNLYQQWKMQMQLLLMADGAVVRRSDDSCQSGTRFLKLADNVPQIYGQRSCIMRTRTLSQRDKLTSLVVNVS